MFAAMVGAAVLGMIMVLYVGANNNMTLGMSLAQVNSDGRLAMDRMVRDVRWARQLVSSRTVSGSNYITGDDEIIIQIPSIDSGGTAIDSTYDYVVYALLETSDTVQLRRIVDPNAASSRSNLNQVIAQNINSILFSSGGTGLSSVGSLSSVTALEIDLTVNKQPLQNKTVSQTLNSDVKLRNN